MRILLVTISLHGQRGGGTAERTRQLALHLTALGRQCTVVAMEDGAHAQALRAAAIPVHITGYIRWKFHIPLVNLAALYRLVKWADRVHILGYWNLLSVASAWVARASGRPYALSAAGEFTALECPRPANVCFHRLFGIGMIRNARSIIAITPLERDQIGARFGHFAPPIAVIPNGVTISPAPARPATFATRTALVFIGRLAPIKGPDLLLEAFALIADRYPDVELILAGPDFGLAAQLSARIAELGLEERASLVGFVDEETRNRLLERALLVCIPSRAEAMSLIALEAGAAGLPVLLTDQCGFDEVAAVGGGTVVPATVTDLSEGLEELLAERETLGARGQRLRDHVGAHYAWPKVAGLLDQHLSTLGPVPR
ncbi:glycosyl transferase family 1 [Agaricicola taiwanensis]|uniref:Glycosyl transferase family 1 n=1 Tax=Agaricicola taiwanensis TaxID=591372 RepID=A0A8J2YH22_9RHOB|nr:glycosyltransferase [Agaricicola taiwanensis]GGE39818.1 glycosyl transferase family 1 [Agaricicola taiwanensis]